MNLPDSMKYGLYGEQGVLAWLEQKTPATSHWLHPVRKPEYGVLARWSLGARIYQIARRPVLSTAFGWETQGFYQEAAFWGAEDEAQAMAIVREARVRYVVVQAIHDLKTDFDVVAWGQARGDLPAATARPVFRPERTMYTRLMQGDGSMMKAGGGMLPSLESFRLVYESRFLAGGGNGVSSELSYYKVFEVVKGAVISGRAAAAAPVVLQLELRTTRQRKLTYLNRVSAGRDGTFAVRVPYATTVQQGDSRPLAAGYRLYVGGKLQGLVRVSEADVVNGKTIRLD